MSSRLQCPEFVFPQFHTETGRHASKIHPFNIKCYPKQLQPMVSPNAGYHPKANIQPPPPIITHPTHSSSKAQTCPPASSPATPPHPAAADNTPPPHPARPDHTLPPVDSTPDSLPPHIPRDIAPAAAMYAPRNTPAAAAASDTPHPPPQVPRRTTRDPAPTTTARMTFLAP